MSSEDRPVGILTRGDREFLRGEKEYQSDEAAINKRREIRRRILNGLLDFSMISRSVWPKDKEKIFEEAVQISEEDNGRFEDAIENMLGWVYSGLVDSDFNALKIFENGINIGESTRRAGDNTKIVQTEVNITVERRDIEGLQYMMRKLENGDPIPARDVFRMVQNDVLVDLSDVDTVSIIADSSEVEAERRMIEIAFSDYFQSDVEIEMLRE